jgi:hypothetical protein
MLHTAALSALFAFRKRFGASSFSPDLRGSRLINCALLLGSALANGFVVTEHARPASYRAGRLTACGFRDCSCAGLAAALGNAPSRQIQFCRELYCFPFFRMSIGLEVVGIALSLSQGTGIPEVEVSA